MLLKEPQGHAPLINDVLINSKTDDTPLNCFRMWLVIDKLLLACRFKPQINLTVVISGF